VRWLCYLCHKAEHPVTEDDKKRKFSDVRPSKLFGANHPSAVLTEDQVRQIKAMLGLGLSQQKIADCFGVSQKHISRIARHKVWSHVT